MALKPLQAMYPLGQFDGYDSELTSFKGGEVCTLTSVPVGVDKAAWPADGVDGYFGNAPRLRPVVTKNLAAVRYAPDGYGYPLFLADDGTSGYGTLFGSVVGGTAGQVSVGGSVLGPHTAVASGKITLWGQAGLYAVTLDAVDTTAGSGLVPDNFGLTAGAPLFATGAGLLTPNAGASAGANPVARFVDFQTNGSLVTTPNFLVAALNSPSGGSAAKLAVTQAVIWFNGGTFGVV